LQLSLRSLVVMPLASRVLNFELLQCTYGGDGRD
jgi:microcystin-dependent protein